MNLVLTQVVRLIMKQAYQKTITPKKSNYFHLISGLIVCLSVSFIPWAGVAYAADICGPVLGNCQIEDRSFTVDHGDNPTTSSSLNVANQGWGKLYIVNGGEATVSNYLQIAYWENSDGLVEVSGPNSKLNVGRDLNVGVHGNGELIITDIANVNVVSSVQIGIYGDGGGSGTATVTNSARLNITNGNLTVSREEGSNGNLIISKGGTVKLNSGDAVIAARDHSNGVVNIGAASGDAAVAPGYLLINDPSKGLVFGRGNGSLVFNHTDNNYVFDPKVTGYGNIFVENGKTIINSNSSGFTGDTVVSGGTLSVSSGARLGGNIDVRNGAVLSGTGTVGTTSTGDVNIDTGGTIAPGNSIGTLKVAGDLFFNPGSMYAVEVDPNGATSDKIHVGGTATLAGSVVHVGLNGNYRPRSTYNILTADLGIVGRFDDAKSNFAFLTPILNYDDRNVNLILERNETQFVDFAKTSNQKSVAKGIASLPANSPLLQKFELLSNDTPASVLDGLSGEAHAGLVTALSQNSTQASTLALSHLRSNMSAGYLPGAMLAQADYMPIPAQAMPRSAAQPLWFQAIGSKQRINGNSNTADIKQDTYGMFTGGDFSVGKGWRLGASLGYTNSKMRMDNRNSKADIDTYTVTTYGGKSFPMANNNAKLNLLMGGSYSWHKIKTDRHAYLSDWSHKLKSNYSANTTQLFGELSYAMQFDDFTIEPFANLAWNRLSIGSFSESGGATALSSKSHTQNNTNSTLGVRASTKFDIGRSTAFVSASLGWQHTFGNINPARSMAFNSGNSFKITGAPIARNSAVVGLSAGVSLSKNTRLGLAYNGQIGGGRTDHSGSINLNWQF